MIMSDSRKALPKDMREKAAKASMEFASQVVSLLENVIDEMTQAMGDQQPAPARRAAAPAKPAPKPAAKPAPKPAAKPAPKPAAKPAPKPAADTGNDIKKRVIAALRKARVPMSVEQLNRVLGTRPGELAIPLQEMIAAGQIQKSGVARGTKYGLA
jgi:hypothetical protein